MSSLILYTMFAFQFKRLYITYNWDSSVYCCVFSGIH